MFYLLYRLGNQQKQKKLHHRENLEEETRREASFDHQMPKMQANSEIDENVLKV